MLRVVVLLEEFEAFVAADLDEVVANGGVEHSETVSGGERPNARRQKKKRVTSKSLGLFSHPPLNIFSNGYFA